MAELNETPSGNRTRISFFGKRNAGKSTLVNAITGQNIAIVSDVAGTTTDPVSKAMEILPLGPCLVTDTAGLDDVGALGVERVRRSLEVLEKTDVAVWVTADDEPIDADFQSACTRAAIPVLIYHRGDSVDALKQQIASVKLADAPRPLIADLIDPGDVIACVCPIDESAPKGRLILPQQQVIREILDSHASAFVCQPSQLPQFFSAPSTSSPAPSTFPLPPAPSTKHQAPSTPFPAPSTKHQAPSTFRFVITDSQAFGAVAKIVPPDVPLTSFSIVFARAKGDLAAYCAGAEALKNLKDGDRVLIAEGCTHHRQCNDIGTVKLPKWLAAYTGRALNFEFCSGNEFPDFTKTEPPALVIQCGGCMLTRRAVQARIARCQAAGVPITNYGIAIAACHGIHAEPTTCMVKRDA